MAPIIEWMQANLTLVLGVLLGLSEALALLPFFKSNSVFQLIVNFLKSVKDFLGPKAP